MRVCLVNGTYRNRFLEVCGVADREVEISLYGSSTFCPRQQRVAFITCRKTDHHSLTPKATEFFAKGGMPRAINTWVEVSTKTEINPMYDQLPCSFVSVANQIERLNDPAIATVAVIIKYFEAIESATRRHSSKFVANYVVFSGDNSCDMGAVTVSIQI